MTRRSAFTLLELLFVFGIIAVLLGIILPTFKGISDESNITKAKTDLALLQNCLEQYYTVHQRYPDAQEYQTILTNEGFLRKPMFDPFVSDRVIEYRCYDDKYYVLISTGINQATDFSDAWVDTAAGELLIDPASDDIIVTNLRRGSE